VNPGYTGQLGSITGRIDPALCTRHRISHFHNYRSTSDPVGNTRRLPRRRRRLPRHPGTQPDKRLQPLERLPSK
jgi:hypothetical protein